MKKESNTRITNLLIDDQPLKWWQWIFYIIGWITGITNLVFWIIMYGLHEANNHGEPFFNKDFHQRVYQWGWAITILLVIVIILILLE